MNREKQLLSCPLKTCKDINSLLIFLLLREEIIGDYLYGYQLNRSIHKQIIEIRQIQEKEVENENTVHPSVVDIETLRIRLKEVKSTKP